jgi:hypothetical protein
MEWLGQRGLRELLTKSIRIFFISFSLRPDISVLSRASVWYPHPSRSSIFLRQLSDTVSLYTLYQRQNLRIPAKFNRSSSFFNQLLHNEYQPPGCCRRGATKTLVCCLPRSEKFCLVDHETNIAFVDGKGKNRRERLHPS